MKNTKTIAMKKILIAISVIAISIQASASENKAEVKPFDRGIGKSSSVFIPKGTIGAGIAFSYNNYNIGNAADDMGYRMLFSLIQGLNGNMMSFGVAPQVSYFLLDNLSVGARFDYKRSNLGLNNADFILTDDLSFSLQDFRYFRQSYTGAVTLRNYIPFGTSKRFAMFTELRALGGYAQAETYTMKKKDEADGGTPYKDGTYQDIYSFELGVVPGITAFLTNEVAFEVSVGLIGFNYQKVKQLANQVSVSEMERSGANFKINLFAIDFGLSFYIPTGAHRMKKQK